MIEYCFKDLIEVSRLSWAGDIIYHGGVTLGLHGRHRARSFLSRVLRREGAFNRSERTELGPHYFLGQPNKVDITTEKRRISNPQSEVSES